MILECVMTENLTPAQEGPDYGAFVSQDMDSSCEHDMCDLFICSVVTGHGDAQTSHAQSCTYYKSIATVWVCTVSCCVCVGVSV